MLQSIRTAFRTISAASVFVVFLTAGAARAGVPDNVADQEWSFQGCNFRCQTNYLQSLKNNFIGKYLKYQSRSYGINLGWDANPQAAVRVGPAGDTQTRALNYGDEVNLSVISGSNVVYGTREWGINLVWSANRRNDWRITGGTPGTPVHTGDKFGLLNLTNNQRLVYCERPYGINLRWAKDCTRAASSTGPFKFSGWMQQQVIVQGYVPYVGTFPVFSANPAVRVDKLFFPTQWPAMLLIKPGRSSLECGNPAAVVRVWGDVTAAQMKEAFGTETITVPLGRQFQFAACIQDVGGQQILPQRPFEITYMTLP